MNIKGQRCGKHPSHPLVGVCALCLTERLSNVESKGWGSSSTSKTLYETSLNYHQNNNNNDTNNGPEPTGKNLNLYKDVIYEAICYSNKTITVEQKKHDFPTAQGSNVAIFGSEKGDKNNQEAEEIISKGRGVDSSEKILGSKISEEASPEMVKHEKESFSNQPHIRSEHGHGSIDEKTRSVISVELKAPIHSEISLLTVDENTASMVSIDLKGPISASIEGIKRSLPSAQMPDLTTLNNDKCDDNQKESGSKSREKDFLKMVKHGSAKEGMCKDSRFCSEISVAPINEKTKSMVSGDLKAGPIDNITNIRSSVRGNALLNTEPQIDTTSFMEDTRASISRTSSSHKHKKNTLSSLFILDDRGTDMEEVKSMQNSSNITNGLSSSVSESSQQCKANQVHEQRRYQHRSFSERADPTKYLFPVPETTTKDSSFSSSSWFSSLFRKRKKSPPDKSAIMNTSSYKSSVVTPQNGWEHARQSWDAPRPSSSAWGLSSFDRPRSSWEPSRPSWDGVVRSSEGDSVLNGIDFYTEGLREVARVSERLRDQGGNDARKVLESKRSGSKSMSKAPQLIDDKNRAKSTKGFQAPKHMLAQTTPPRTSDATEIFIQERLSNDRNHHHYRQYGRTSNALWSKVWTKTFSNPKWAFKTKHDKGQIVKEEGDVIMTSKGDAHDQGKIVSSSPEHANETTHRASHLRHFNSIMEHETRWNAYYGPILKKSNDDGEINNLKVAHPQKDLVNKENTPIQKDGQEDQKKGSSFMLENGLLSFYLTPVRRGQGRGKGIMMV